MRIGVSASFKGGPYEMSDPGRRAGRAPVAVIKEELPETVH